MKSWWMTSGAGSAGLALREVPVPDPGEGELLVRVRAASLNRGEFIASVGLHKPGAERPAGVDAAGTVERVGPGASGFAPGDRVMGRAAGGFSEFVRMQAIEAMQVPAALDWRAAAAVPLTFCVTWDMLVAHGRLKALDWLLVTGVSSGVGVSCLQLGKALGARVIGTSGSAAKLEALRDHGLDAGLLTRGPDFAEKVRELTGGRGADVCVNNVGGSLFAECMRACAFEGRMATVGYVDRVLTAQIDIGLLHEQRLELFGVSNKLRRAPQRAETVRGVVRDVLPLLAAGTIRPLVARHYPFADLPAARAFMESDAQIGKIVLDVAPD